MKFESPFCHYSVILLYIFTCITVFIRLMLLQRNLKIDAVLSLITKYEKYYEAVDKQL